MLDIKRNSLSTAKDSAATFLSRALYKELIETNLKSTPIGNQGATVKSRSEFQKGNGKL